MASRERSASSDPASMFESQRGRLIGLAYRMTGSRSEAEDIVQEAWIRWASLDPDTVDDPPAFLFRVVSRLCLDHARSARVRRERYVGEWLPEPVMDAEALSAQSRLERADDITFALLLVLDRLSPAERAAFLLHDVFDVPFDEIARSLDRTPAACRQLASRGRRAVQSAAAPAPLPAPDRVEPLVDAFLAAAREGDVEGLTSYFTDDAVALSDGGGKVLAALNPIRSADHIARFLVGVTRKLLTAGVSLRPVPARLNGMPGVLVYEGGVLRQAALFEVTEDLVISRLYLIRNPDKLALLREHAHG